MVENNVRLLQRRRGRREELLGRVEEVETNLTKEQLKAALNHQTGQLAEMLAALNNRLSSLGIQKLTPNGRQNHKMQNALNAIAQQTRATTALLDMPFRELPRAIQERMIGGFKRAMVNGAKSPFTLAAYVGYHGVIMPIPVVIKHAGGLFYKLYCYFFVFVVIFGTRHYMIEYAEDERAQRLLNFAYGTLYYIIYPTQMLMNMVRSLIQVSLGRFSKNLALILPGIQNGIGKAGELAHKAVCDNVPSWTRWAIKC